MRPYLYFTLFALLFAHAPAAMACNEHDLEDPSLVQVLQPSFTTSKTDGPVFVTVIGTFKNTSSNKVENLVVEAKLTDAQGKVIDVLSQPVYGVAVPAGQEVAFRVQGQAAAAQASYSGVQVRVSSGESHIARQPRPPAKEASPWLDVLVSWGPMLLLILVWVVLARKYSGRGSTQDKMLLAVNEQNALLARQLSAIESIAQAAKSAPRGEAFQETHSK
jgi:ATP-dependent Zn protease